MEAVAPITRQRVRLPSVTLLQFFKARKPPIGIKVTDVIE